MAHLAALSIGALLPSGCRPTGPAPPISAGHPDPHAVDVELGRRLGTDARTGRNKPPRAVPAVAHDSEEPAAVPASFGLYVLALSWAPSFCCGHQSSGQCRALAGSFGADHLTLHGLWPSYTDAEGDRAGADYPVYCGKYSACKERSAPAFCYPDPATIPAEMSRVGPGYVTDDDLLANHEWPKHGSCSGLDAAAFFTAAIRSLLALPGESGTPDVLRRNAGAEVAVADLRASFGAPESVLLSCDPGCHLVQVGICLAHDERGQPTRPIACPDNTTGSEYDNGCLTRRCASIRIQRAGQCHGGGP